MLASDPENTLAIAFLGGLGNPFIKFAKTTVKNIFENRISTGIKSMQARLSTFRRFIKRLEIDLILRSYYEMVH
ncbi:hypothetical protein [Cronobacter turicensis]|uniref:Uncharacterized protein n=1 Tax=Cronobacter turicensis TaxID=413502 RepID=A0ACD5IYP8_9ENTR